MSDVEERVGITASDVFVINDINLQIPPSSISIRQEDLTYQWRTLRTSTSTKVPSGHGQTMVSVTIPFLNSQLLQMHRLIIELKNSPFCYVDNAWLRLNLVPDWAPQQNMAFTLFGIQVSPMRGTIDCWQVELDMQWFNYFPYGTNYLFREEWNTNWVDVAVPTAVSNAVDPDSQVVPATVKYSIGWTLNPRTRERTNRPCVVETTDQPVTLRQWSAQKEDYDHKTNRTVQDMEAAHDGQIFDLLPMPTNMEQSRFVYRPEVSRIYTRYINLLQRDALMENFDIDVESDLDLIEPGSKDRFFSNFIENDDTRTVGLHTRYVPKVLRDKWIGKMLETNGSISFYYDLYKEVRMPQEWTEKMQGAANTIAQKLLTENFIPAPIDAMQGPIEGDGWSASTGVSLNNTQWVFLNQLATDSGVFIDVRSGIRTPESQARAMTGKIVAGDNRDAMMAIYDDRLMAECWPAGTTWSESYAREMIWSQVGRGQFISRHMRGDALDIHITNMSDQDLAIVISTAESLGAQTLMESNPPHLHIEEVGGDFIPTREISPLTQELVDKGEISDDEANAFVELMKVLDAEGYHPYDDQTNIQNLWYKTINHRIGRNDQNLDEITRRLTAKSTGDVLGSVFVHDSVVLTNVVGQLRHVIANIPILGYEYPTHQHLGSIEPSYTLEFAVLDDSDRLEGISTVAAAIQFMRSRLQSNARKYRPVVGSSNALTDTFITRLFGSTRVYDYIMPEPTREVREILKKRIAISRSSCNTVPGHPGLSSLIMELEETNPFEGEKIVSTAPKLRDINNAYERILKGVMEGGDQFKPDASYLPIMIAQLAGVDTSQLQGDFPVQYWSGISNLSNSNVTYANMVHTSLGLSPEPQIGIGGQTYLLLKDSDGSTEKLLRSMGVVFEVLNNNITGSAVSYLAIDPNLVPGLVQTSTPLSSTGQNVIDAANTLTAPIANMAQDAYNNGIGTAAWNYAAGNSMGVAGNTLDALREIDLNDLSTANFSVTQYLMENANLATANFGKLLGYHTYLMEILRSGERMLAENVKGGYTQQELSSQLYGVPIQNHMWESFQLFFNSLVRGSGLSSNPNALVDNPNYFNVNNLTKETQNDILWAWLIFGPKMGTNMVMEPVDNIADYLMGQFYAFLNGDVALKDYYQGKLDEIRFLFIGSYIDSFPLAVIATEAVTSVASDFKWIIGDWTHPGDHSLQAAFYLRQAFKGYLDSCNLLFMDPIGKPYIEDPGYGVITRSDGSTGVNTKYYIAGGGVTENPIGFMLQWDAFTIDKIMALFMSENTNLGHDLGRTPTKAELEALRIKLINQWHNGIQIGPAIGAPCQYPTNKADEDAKIRYIKQLLAALAREILNDSGLLTALGLQDLVGLSLGNDYVGTPAYPDMTLPFHPFYGTLFHVGPDFYMWNMYEDGGANGADFQNDVKLQAHEILLNGYNSMKRFQGKIPYSPKNVPLVAEPNVDQIAQVNLSYDAEGVDGNKEKPDNPMGNPFAMSKASNDAEAAFYKSWDPSYQKFNESSLGGSGGEIYSFRNGKELSLNTKPPMTKDWKGNSTYEMKVGTTDGSAMYPMRVTPGKYTELWEHINSLESMFGNRAGYIGEQLTDSSDDTITPGTKETNVEQADQFTHRFDKDFLNKLADESSRDIIGQKMSMKRAYPTFKLFFVEEDEIESRFLNYDDFYSFNAVKEFSVVLDSKMAADTAVITLQNITGTLDGTARNTITDLDYFSRTRTKAIEKDDPTTGTLSGDPTYEGTDHDQAFGAIVLRPGLNVQLRAGYSNDPTALEVLISGRVVDLAWNQTGDLVEITVQSFGAELEQVIKGTGINNDTSVTFYTTHQLLGSMMLEPELAHFGRWEFGQHFQIGESKDSRLDFVDYSREGVMGRFKAVDRIGKWIVSHPGTIFMLALVTSAASVLIPETRLTGLSGRALKVLGVKGIKGAETVGDLVGEAALRKGIEKEIGESFLKAAVNGPIRATEIAQLERNAGQRALNIAFARKEMLLRDISYEAAVQSRTATAPAIDAALAGELFTEDGLTALVKAGVARDRNLAARLFGGRWMGVSTFSPWEVGYWTSSGWSVTKNLAWTELNKNFRLGSVALIGGLVLDLIRTQIAEPIMDGTIYALKKAFTRAEVSMMLSPQDDNLYPPSPKDYMVVKRDGFVKDLAKMAIMSGSRLLTSTDEYGNLALAYWDPGLLFSKKVEPQQCQYHLITSTIWDVFYEMTLRHPGWIFSPRPYGRDFRYTMFFGVPSQRYWSKPVSNGFVDRMNKLKTFLAGGPINEQEYRALYGDVAPDKVGSLEDYIQKFEVTTGSEFSSMHGLGTHASPEEIIQLSSQMLQQQYRARAMDEYLHGLELRFIPFRRYHFLSSSRDLVWNGIVSSESAVTNAVDVSYFDYDNGSDLGQVQGTVLIKAHSTMPDDSFRIRPIQYRNCRGYTMGMRYGMGELIHSMKEMYRGEIIVLGNPRIRPQDIGILADTYNDMVGPIEVEQVVHTFSHETGFITEIKPGAVVIGNEISSWPIIEAMKLWSLAVHDAEQNMVGVGGSPGGIKTLADWIGQFGGKDYNSFIEKKYHSDLYFPEGANLAMDAFGGKTIPNVQVPNTGLSLMKSIPQVNENAFNIRFLAALGGLESTNFSGLGGLVSTGLTGIPTAALIKHDPTGVYGFAKESLQLQVGAERVIVGVNDIMTFPSMAWLIGGVVLFARCLREDAVIVVPLMKGGQPVVAGLSYHDPSMLWSNFKGDLNNFINDAVGGLRDVLDEWERFGSAVWKTVKQPTFGTDQDQLTNSAL